MLLRCEPPATRGCRALAPRRDYQVLHAAHTDWVTRVEHIPGAAGRGEAGLLVEACGRVGRAELPALV